MSLNKVMLIGNLGSDPEMRQTNNKKPYCRFSVATNERVRTDAKNFTERTTWHDIVVFGNNAASCGKYLHKGSKVYLEGPLRSYETTDEAGQKRKRISIVPSMVKFLDSQGHSEATEQDELDVSDLELV